ncbi:flocculation protein FLO11-like [Ischnura elegans]|uniref:flocculation protein FLO11-like n=1 Tax=Ischnura elegans TaxID=197161 RepID=UPI001ED87AD9|nr:flocculation protein FLO11-like [Ischnura elegans]XP_046392166.1 flocculation protein FLO11-like [Ischnura elegans]XP_046392433.1 flocculation protein FLO11-like [Ischnura elegans]
MDTFNAASTPSTAVPATAVETVTLSITTMPSASVPTVATTSASVPTVTAISASVPTAIATSASAPTAATSSPTTMQSIAAPSATAVRTIFYDSSIVQDSSTDPVASFSNVPDFSIDVFDSFSDVAEFPTHEDASFSASNDRKGSPSASTSMGSLAASSPPTMLAPSIRQTLLEAQKGNEFLKKEEMVIGKKFLVTKIEKINTRYGEKLVGHIKVRGVGRRLILPAFLKLSMKDIMMFNYGGEELYVGRDKNNLIKIF